MTLVGATGAFIRRPFLVSNVISGLIAGLIADMILAGGIVAIGSGDPVISSLVTWNEVAVVLAGVVLAGMLICLVASVFSTNRYLYASYDDMFK